MEQNKNSSDKSSLGETIKNDMYSQWERRKSIEDYTEILKQADKNVLDQLQKFSLQTQRTHKISLYIYLVGIFIAVVVFIFSVILIFQGESKLNTGKIGVLAGILFFLLLIYLSPMKRIRNLMADTMKIQVILLGYVRQLNQIDVVFKHMITVSSRISISEMQQTLSQIQETATATINDINILLEDFNEFSN